MPIYSFDVFSEKQPILFYEVRRQVQELGGVS